MNNSTSTFNQSHYAIPTIALADLDRSSIDQLRAIMIPSLIISLIALLALITNTLTVYVIIRSKELHNKSQFVILTHAWIEILFAASTFLNNIRKFIYAAFFMSDTIYRINCIFILIPLIISAKLAVFAVGILGVDRFLIVARPLYYKALDPGKYLLVLNCLLWLLGLAHIPFLFLGGFDGKQILPLCHYNYVVNSGVRVGVDLESQVLIGGTSVMYAGIAAIVAYRYWGWGWRDGDQRSAWARQIQMGAFKMMMLIGCLLLISWGLAQAIVYILTNHATPRTAITYSPYIAVIQISNTASHFFVYMYMSASFRRACKERLVKSGGATGPARWFENSVAPS